MFYKFKFTIKHFQDSVIKYTPGPSKPPAGGVNGLFNVWISILYNKLGISINYV